MESPSGLRAGPLPQGASNFTRRGGQCYRLLGMELTCSRCHQAVQPGACFCPVCGLPQLVYSAETAPEADQPTRWNEAVRDAGTIVWKPALRSALALAIPAGVLCSFFSPLGILGFLLMPVASAWVVSLYTRAQRPPWITISAGARIGLVTGIVGGWFAAATTAVTLYAMRFWFHQGKIFDNLWENSVSHQVSQWTAMGADNQSIDWFKNLLLSPEGRAASFLCGMALLTTALLLFSIAGGALGARMQVKKHRPEA